MANTAQARKRARQAEATRKRNASLTSELRTAVKKVRKAIAAGDKAAASKQLQESQSAIDRVADGFLALDANSGCIVDANPAAVSDIFTSDNGVAVKLAGLMGTKTSVAGELTVRSDNVVKSLEDLKDQQEALDARMKVVEQRYFRQF